MTVDWVTIERFADDVGMSNQAVKKRVGYRSTGEIWPEGLVWIKLEGRIYISRSGWDRWLELKRRDHSRRHHSNRIYLPRGAVQRTGQA